MDNWHLELNITPRTRLERLHDWWEWTAKEMWFGFRYRLGEKLEDLSQRVKP